MRERSVYVTGRCKLTTRFQAEIARHRGARAAPVSRDAALLRVM